VKEREIQASILDWLAAKKILAFRMNTGAVKMEKRFIRFGVPGMADILAFSREKSGEFTITPTWIEVKTDRGTQSEYQKSFQKLVEEYGHVYVIARSIEDVEAAVL
jgi:hypothetical protein